MLPLNDHLTTTSHNESNCEWTRHDVAYTGEFTDSTLAKTIACLIVKTRCPDSLYQKWLAALENRRELTDLERSELETFIKPSIGLRAAPASDNQVQAVVAEHIWFELVRNDEGPYGLPIKITEPSLRVTEPGGDGLAIYQTGENTYIFRLWEIKKHISSSSASSKITKASKQLTSNGAEYLAKVSKVGQEADHQYPGLSAFYAELVSMWLQADTKANAGVTVSKDHMSSISSAPISIMKRHMPTFVGERQLEGLIVSIPNFAELAEKVREELWKGI